MANFRLCNIRIIGNNKTYLLKQFENFALNIGNREDSKIKTVEFGKQDIRGGFSITLIDKKDCIPFQKFFNSKDEMIGFVCGFNTPITMFNDFERFMDYKIKVELKNKPE